MYCANGHEEIINAIDGCGGINIGGGAPEVVTGSRDGQLHNAFPLSFSLCMGYCLLACSTSSMNVVESNWGHRFEPMDCLGIVSRQFSVSLLFVHLSFSSLSFLCFLLCKI